jgi:excisionase family DNA binding protein
MEWWSVRETADQLGVSEQRVRAMAKSGRLPASRVGHRWVIESDSARLRRPHPGRPLAAGNAWALLALLSGNSPDWVHPSVRSRLRRRLSDIDWLEAALAHSEPRARILRWRVLPGDLGKLQVADYLVRSGLSAHHAELDVWPNPQQIDAYVSENSLRGMELRFRPERSSSRPNMILRLPSHEWILRQEPQAPQAVVAADLLGHDDPRVARAARHLLYRLASG